MKAKHKKLIASALEMTKEEEEVLASRLTGYDMRDLNETYDAAKHELENLRSNPLKQEVAKSETCEAFKKCSLCGNIGKEIRLGNDRQAYYCVEHRVVLPGMKDVD